MALVRQIYQTFVLTALGLLWAHEVGAGPSNDAGQRPPSGDEILVEGILSALEEVRRQMGKDRSKAMMALDEAMRAADVGKHAASPRLRASMAATLKNIERIRRAVQNGNDEKAGHRLARAMGPLRNGPPGGREAEPQPPASAERLKDYKGATVINARGRIVGELVDVRDDNGNGYAVVAIGGWRDVLGFLDFGGDRIEVPAPAVMLGQNRTIGHTFLALKSEKDKQALKAASFAAFEQAAAAGPRRNGQ